MQPVRKIEIKRMYLEETGNHPPETDVQGYIEAVRRYFARHDIELRYKDMILYYEDEPDFLAIQDYIEWLEQKLIE